MPPRKRRTTQQAPESSSGPPADANKRRKQPSNLEIDYDKLAEAILKKQSNSTGTSASLSVTSPTCSSEHFVHSSVNSTGLVQCSNQQPEVLTNITTQVPATDQVPTTNPAPANPHVSTTTPVLATTHQPLNDNMSVPGVLNTLFRGESAASIDPQPLNFSNNIQLGATVSDKIKQKIWGDTYFDIRLLLPNQQEENFSVSIERRAINFQQGKFNKFPISINQWTSAFLIFTSIYIQKKLEEAPHLLKYMFMIREMASTTRSDSWRQYDEDFRKLRQTTHLRLQEPLTELVLRSSMQATATYVQPTSKFRQTNQPSLAKGRPVQGNKIKFCYSYNQGQPCRSDPCQYKHACQFRRDDHPRHKCPKFTSSTQDKPTATPKATINNKARSAKGMAMTPSLLTILFLVSHMVFA